MDAVEKAWCIDSSIRCNYNIMRCSRNSCIVHIKSTESNSNMVDDIEYHSSTNTSKW